MKVETKRGEFETLTGQEFADRVGGQWVTGAGGVAVIELSGPLPPRGLSGLPRLPGTIWGALAPTQLPSPFTVTVSRKNSG